MDIDIRPALPDEYPAAAEVMSTAFLERDDPQAVVASIGDMWEPGRT